MTSDHLLVSGKKKKPRFIWNLLQGQLAVSPDAGYPSLGLFWPLLLFLQPFDHLLISPLVRGERSREGPSDEI